MSYKLVFTKSYEKKLLKFLRKNRNLVEKYEKTIYILEKNPFHPSLRLHKLSGKLRDFHSVSIDMSYRIVIDFIIEDEKIIPINIGSHDEIY
ncbi:hypothetical protein ThvES_00018920 [Thiovulum sp. ES]|nr:hypothetical protein ThvES_00018920 [Thiovulum sp. ES]